MKGYSNKHSLPQRYAEKHYRTNNTLSIKVDGLQDKSFQPKPVKPERSSLSLILASLSVNRKRNANDVECIVYGIALHRFKNPKRISLYVRNIFIRAHS